MRFGFDAGDGVDHVGGQKGRVALKAEDSVTGPGPKHPRLILAENVNRLIDGDLAPGARRSVRAWALAKGLDVRMVDRVTKGQNDTGLDTLNAIASAVGVEAWCLLVDGKEDRPVASCKVVARAGGKIFLALDL